MDDAYDRNFKANMSKSKYIMETATAVFNSQCTTLCDIRVNFQNVNSSTYDKMYENAETVFNTKTDEAFEKLGETIDEYILGTITSIEVFVNSNQDIIGACLEKVNLESQCKTMHLFDNKKLQKRI